MRDYENKRSKLWVDLRLASTFHKCWLMSKARRFHLRTACLGALIAAALYLAVNRPLTEERARIAASRKFEIVCRDLKVDPLRFSGPLAAGMKGSLFSYKWIDTKTNSDLVILIIIMTNGGVEATYHGSDNLVTDPKIFSHVPGEAE